MSTPTTGRPKCLCGRKSSRRGMCWGCYQQMLAARKIAAPEALPCLHCPKPSRRSGMCWGCYDKRRDAGLVKRNGRVHWIVDLIGLLSPEERAKVMAALEAEAA